MMAVRPCPVCGSEMGFEPVYDATSRADNSTHICSDCGVREAIADLHPVEGMPRFCYSDRYTERTVLITRGLPGYHRLTGPIADVPASDLNSRLGVCEEVADDMVSASMFDWTGEDDDSEEEGLI